MHPSVTVNRTLELTLVDLLTKTNYIKYFIEMRLKGHPIVLKQVPFRSKFQVYSDSTCFFKIRLTPTIVDQLSKPRIK